MVVTVINMTRISSTNQNGGMIKTHRPDLNYQWPLHILSVILGISVPIDLRKYKVLNSLLFKIYSFCLIIVIIYATIWSGIGRYKYAYQFLLQTMKINDVIQQFLLGCSTIFAILNITVKGHSTMVKYFDKMRKIDMYLSTTMNLTSKKVLYFFRFISFHIIIIILSYYDYYGWSKTMAFELWIYYSFRLFMFYINMIIVLQIAAIACSIHTRFTIINERLLDTFLNWTTAYDSQMKIQLKKELCPNTLTVNFMKYLPIKKISNIHDILCDVIDIVNELYGFNIFLLVSNIIVNCVMSLNIILIFGTGIQVAQNRDYEYIVLALNAAWAIYFMVSLKFDIFFIFLCYAYGLQW